MVRESPVCMTCRHDTCTIHFRDATTGTIFYTDGTDIPTDIPAGESRDDKEAKVDLVQHYLLHTLDANGHDCRGLSRLLRANNLKVLLPMVMALYLDENKDDVEKGLRGVYAVVGRMIAVLEKRDEAREGWRGVKKEREEEEARREEEAGEGGDELY